MTKRIYQQYINNYFRANLFHRELHETLKLVIMNEHDIKLRKLDHIFITLSKRVEEGESLLDEVALIHQSLPELDFNEVSTESLLLGKKLSAPLIVTGMTGGHPLSGEINAILAEVAEEKKIAIGVGSQRAGLLNSSLCWTYRVVRDRAPSVPVIGNLGAQQLLQDDFIELAEKAVEMIEADALAIHLNPAQEVFQPEGDPHYKGIFNRLSILVEKLGVPIIVKETGNGISMETALLLKKSGVKIIDVGGLGGTSWVKVEMYRAKRNRDTLRARASKSFVNWGIPTALSVLEVKTAYPEATVICSGGVRTGLDIARCIALGADYAGMALPFLKAAVKGKSALQELIDKVTYELKVALFLTGSRNIEELRTKKPVLGPRITTWINQRNLKYPGDKAHEQ